MKIPNVPTFFDITVPVVQAYLRAKEIAKMPEAQRKEANLRGKLHCVGLSDDEIEAEVKKARETGDWT